jgi:hypothetical protein
MPGQNHTGYEQAAGLSTATTKRQQLRKPRLIILKSRSGGRSRRPDQPAGCSNPSRGRRCAPCAEERFLPQRQALAIIASGYCLVSDEVGGS